jgi:DinB family protein
MTDSVHDNNDRSRQRLATVVARLTEADLAKVIDGEWTVAAELGHPAFWDRVRAATWTEALAAGRDGPTDLPPGVSDLVNEVGIRDWTRIPGRLAAQGALEDAERIDALIAGLAPEKIAAMIASDRRTLVDRSRHRGEHLDTIEGAIRAS